MDTAKQMKVMLVCANCFHFNWIPVLDTYRGLFDNFHHLCFQKRLSVLYGKDNVIMDLPMHSGKSVEPYLCERDAHLLRVPEKEDPIASNRGIFKLKLDKPNCSNTFTIRSH